MDALGAQYSAGAGYSTSFADVVSLKNVFPQAMALAAKTIIAPSFPASEFGRVKNQAVAAYEQTHARAAGLAADAFIRAAFDSTAPFSRPASGTLTTIGALTRDDVVAWHKSMFAPSAATFLIVGDITPADAKSIAEQAFGGWTATRAPLPPVVNKEHTPPGGQLQLADGYSRRLLARSMGVGRQTNQRSDHVAKGLVGRLAVNPFLDRHPGQSCGIEKTQPDHEVCRLPLGAKREERCGQESEDGRRQCVPLTSIHRLARSLGNAAVHRNAEIPEDARSNATAKPGVRSQIEAESVAALRCGASTEGRPPFEKSDHPASARQIERCRKACQSSADHDDMLAHGKAHGTPPLASREGAPGKAVRRAS